LSQHSFGTAIDINPVQNPCIRKGVVEPAEGIYFQNRSVSRKGMVIRGGICYRAFIKRSWQWGGDWTSLKDYQHFEKNLPEFLP